MDLFDATGNKAEAAKWRAELDRANGQPVPADVATAFANASGSSGSESGSQGTGNGNFTLPVGCVVTVVTASAEWYIGPTNNPFYDLRRETDSVNVFAYPTPAFSPRNYYLDSRSYAKEQKYYLRQVALIVLMADAGAMLVIPGILV